MILLFYIVSLFIAVYTLNYYIGFNVKTSIHRLLPMAVGFIGVFEVCQILKLITDTEIQIGVLEDLVVLECLYLLTHYILEFYYIKIPKRMECLFSASLIFVGITALLQFEFSFLYSVVYQIYTFGYLILLLIFGVFTYRKNVFSRKERKVVGLLFVALVVSIVSLLFRNTKIFDGRIFITLAFDFTSLVAFYLMKTNQLVDNATLMQTNLFDTAEFGIVLFDTDLFMLESNDVARELFPKNFNKSRREEQGLQLRDSVKRLVSREDKTAEFEFKERFYLAAVEEFVCQGELRGYIMTIADITEQKQEMKKLEELRQIAEEQNLSKSRFLASMSHDLRSPLHAIVGASDVLVGKNNLTAMNRSYVQMIRKSSKVLLGLVNEILLYSKLEAGKLVLSNNAYSFEGMLKDLAQMMIVNLQEKPVDFLLNFHNDYPEEVVGDQMRVREVIQNLLSNAVKFTEQGKIVCDIFCETEPEKERIKISCTVTDTGIGMSKEQIKAIFDEYTSFAHTRSKEGTGLGMSIVRQLATLMDGNVQAESDGKTGSSVSVCFYQGLKETDWHPAVQFSKKELMKRTVKMETFTKPAVQYMDAKVLAVDDIEANRQVFKQIAMQWGIDADTAASGKEAISMAGKKEYHLIFMDLMMPEMDGIETAAEIRKFSEVPLILLTADASDETKRKSTEVGFSAYMGKPIDTAELEKAFEKYIPGTCQMAVGKRIDKDAFDEQRAKREMLAHRTILLTVIAELEQLHENLEHYFVNDLTMFRIKVHGIKGLTRQIFKPGISRQAEIMEMAAKTENRRFIEENLDDFLLEIKETLEEIKEEVKALPEPEVEETGETKEDLWNRLKEAFDDFDLKTAEECVRQLKMRQLSKQEEALLEQAEEACEEIDYEAGSSVLEDYLEKQR